MELELTPEQAIAQHAAGLKPRHTDTSKQNNWTEAPNSWNAPQLSLKDARAARHAEIQKANAENANKPEPVTPTPEEVHQDIVARRRANGGVQQFNRKSFA